MFERCLRAAAAVRMPWTGLCHGGRLLERGGHCLGLTKSAGFIFGGTAEAVAAATSAYGPLHTRSPLSVTARLLLELIFALYQLIKRE